MKRKAVLDSSALLAVVHQEPGAEVVRPLLEGAAVSAVNLSEVASKLIDRGIPSRSVKSGLLRMSLRVYGFDDEAAFATANLRTAVPKDVSLGDRACLALAAYLGAEAVTADRAWATFGLSSPTIRLIR